MRFSLWDMAMAALPRYHFILPVGLTTAMFLLVGQRKVGLVFGFSFLASWLILSMIELFVAGRSWPQ